MKFRNVVAGVMLAVLGASFVVPSLANAEESPGVDVKKEVKVDVYGGTYKKDGSPITLVYVNNFSGEEVAILWKSKDKLDSYMKEDRLGKEFKEKSHSDEGNTRGVAYIPSGSEDIIIGLKYAAGTEFKDLRMEYKIAPVSALGTDFSQRLNVEDVKVFDREFDRLRQGGKYAVSEKDLFTDDYSKAFADKDFVSGKAKGKQDALTVADKENIKTYDKVAIYGVTAIVGLIVLLGAGFYAVRKRK